MISAMATISEALAIAVRHHQAGRLQAAEQIYRQILAVEPTHADALHLLGVVANQSGQHATAIECIARAIALRGTEAAFHNNLGEAYRALRRTPEAVARYRRALELKPDFAEAHYNLGLALKEQGMVDEAVACYRRALELKPDYAKAHNNLGNAFREQGKLDEAVACCRRALELRPDFAEAHYILGNAFKDQAKLEEAVASYRRALELKPSYVEAHSNLVYALNFCPGYDAKTIYEELRRWSRQFAEPLAKFIQPHSNDRSLDRRLRIGYVSPDFRDHAESFFTVPFFAAHDHDNFEIFCYADVIHPDGTTARLRESADVWRDIAGLTDEQIAQRVREDRIDILVDLTMHMAHNHLLVFARKPAPVQVCWLAYQGTTGLSAIDYRLTDAHVDPPGLNDRYYAEESIRLPDSFACYDPLTSEPAVNALPALERGQITFGSLNNFCKLNAEVLRLWAQVLKAVDHSQIMILAAEGTHRQDTLDLLRHAGVAPERVILVGKRSRPQYLQLYQRIDIGLDTFPYNGQTTSLDAFWMGVPVVTMVGKTAVGRAGLSLLRSLGLPELIADTPEQFTRVAVELAGDLPRLSNLRATLRERMRQSPLMDASHFARNAEAAYRAMWQRWCAK